MAGPALTEQEILTGTTNNEIVQSVPNQEEELIENVVPHVQQMEPGFQKEDATSHASRPISESRELRQVGAERVGAGEPLTNMVESMTDFVEKTGGNVMTDARGGGLMDYGQSVPGKRGWALLKERLGRLLPRK